MSLHPSDRRYALRWLLVTLLAYVAVWALARSLTGCGAHAAIVNGGFGVTGPLDNVPPRCMVCDGGGAP